MHQVLTKFIVINQKIIVKKSKNAEIIYELHFFKYLINKILSIKSTFYMITELK